MSYGFGIELVAENDEVAAAYKRALLAAAQGWNDAMVVKGGHTPSVNLSVARGSQSQVHLDGSEVTYRNSIKLSLSISGHVDLTPPAPAVEDPTSASPSESDSASGGAAGSGSDAEGTPADAGGDAPA